MKGCSIEIQDNETINSKLNTYFEFNQKGQEEYASKDYKETKFKNDARKHYRNYFEDDVKSIKEIINKFCPQSLTSCGKYAIKININNFTIKWIPKIVIKNNLYTNNLISNDIQKIQKCVNHIKVNILNADNVEKAQKELDKNWQIFKHKNWLINPEKNQN